MPHIVEIAADATTVGLTVVMILIIVAIARRAAKIGPETVAARLFLRQKEAARAALVLVIGLVVFMTSNLLELYGDIEHIDWVVNEIVEIGTMVAMIAGLLLIARLVHVPDRQTLSIALEDPAAEGPR
jgi:undecaprenyl pyrophosphate phosphatase UppP